MFYEYEQLFCLPSSLYKKKEKIHLIKGSLMRP